MSFREKAQIVVVSVAVALALAAGFFYVSGRITSPTEPSLGPGRILTPTDDQPIVMTGGSFYIGTGDTATFRAAGDYLEYKSGYKVFRIDVLDKSNMNTMTDVLADASGQIDIVYCNLNGSQCTPNQTDTVKMLFNNNVANPVIRIENTLSDRPIGKARRILPTLRTHTRKRWTMSSVKVTIGTTMQTFTCEDDSECEIVVHTCTSGTGCMASD